MKKFITLAVTGLVLVSMSACGSGYTGPDGVEGEPSAPVTKAATNVEMFKVPGSLGFSEGIIVFDIERDGQVLTCTTKQNYNSGVGCVVKKEQ